MAQSKPGPRRPATKLPHLQKQMRKNIVPKHATPPKFTGRKKTSP
jgi:hypothetical protein